MQFTLLTINLGRFHDVSKRKLCSTFIARNWFYDMRITFTDEKEKKKKNFN